jgi:hypothetical protein
LIMITLQLMTDTATMLCPVIDKSHYV